MSDFWMGVLVLPAAIAALAVAGAMFFGTWKLYESWSENRLVRLREVRMPTTTGKPGGFQITTLPDFGGREFMTSLMLTSKRVSLLRFTNNTGVIIIRGGVQERNGQDKLIEQALQEALIAVHKRQHEGEVAA